MVILVPWLTLGVLWVLVVHQGGVLEFVTVDMHFILFLIQAQLSSNIKKEATFLCALGQIAVIIALWASSPVWVLISNQE